MKKSQTYVAIFFLIIFCSFCSSQNTDEIINIQPVSDEIYFPSLQTDDWETVSISELNWNENQLQLLLEFLETKNTKSFIILHKGKIAVEAYFNNHDATKFWYWASAGKTITTAISGIAESENLINLDAKVSDYLGENWTNIPLEKENLITGKNLLSMTSGLDDSLGDAVSKENLQYKADADSRWAYHNVYVKIQDVIANATKTDFTNYFDTKLKDKIGMNGFWRKSDNFNVYWSNSRSMARFGLLIANNGKWENSQVIPENFVIESTLTSQNINKAYGYLWWLNGKESYLLPQSQNEFSGKLIPNAPNDMFAALGKNDQKIYIVPSKKLVVIRMGEAAETSNFALSTFDNDLWARINGLID